MGLEAPWKIKNTGPGGIFRLYTKINCDFCMYIIGPITYSL